MQGPLVKAKLGRDDWAQRSFMLVIGALPDCGVGIAALCDAVKSLFDLSF
jgi:hypothetical protein